jgi:hypothetical protein
MSRIFIVISIGFVAHRIGEDNSRFHVRIQPDARANSSQELSLIHSVAVVTVQVSTFDPTDESRRLNR